MYENLSNFESISTSPIMLTCQFWSGRHQEWLPGEILEIDEDTECCLVRSFGSSACSFIPWSDLSLLCLTNGEDGSLVGRFGSVQQIQISQDIPAFGHYEILSNYCSPPRRSK